MIDISISGSFATPMLAHRREKIMNTCCTVLKKISTLGYIQSSDYGMHHISRQGARFQSSGDWGCGIPTSIQGNVGGRKIRAQKYPWEGPTIQGNDSGDLSQHPGHEPYVDEKIL